MSVAAPRSTARRWLLGPAPDLLLGCGVLYLIAFAALWVARPAMDGMQAPLQLLILFTSVPHYGATLLRAYRTRETRETYRLYTIYLIIPIALAYVVALHDVAFASVLVTVYLTWSPWHYSGQNYGIALMFLRRRGVEVTPLARRFLKASFVLSFILLFLAFHVAGGDPVEDPTSLFGGDIRFIPLGISPALYDVAFPLVAAADAIALAGAFFLIGRRRRIADLVPTALVAGIQALWFTVPKVLAYLYPEMARSGQTQTFGYLLIAIAHAVQYLWITAYYARTSGSSQSHAGFFAMTTLAGAAVWFLPPLVFAPGTLGNYPYDAGLGLVTSAAINIHHFILDGVVWKLRDTGVAKVLIADERTKSGTKARLGRIGILLPAIGVASLALTLVIWNEEVGYRRAYATGDLERVESAAHTLTALGRDSSRLHIALGTLRNDRGDGEGALLEFARSQTLFPSAQSWMGIGVVHEQRGDRAAALGAFRNALELDPESTFVRKRIAQLEAALGSEVR